MIKNKTTKTKKKSFRYETIIGLIILCSISAILCAVLVGFSNWTNIWLTELGNGNILIPLIVLWGVVAVIIWITMVVWTTMSISISKKRCTVASNQSTPLKTLIKLTKTKDWNVADALLENPNKYLIIQDKLSRNKDPYIRQKVARSKALSSKTLFHLCEDKSQMVAETAKNIYEHKFNQTWNTSNNNS